jgi:ubiquinone biosynthesis protein
VRHLPQAQGTGFGIIKAVETLVGARSGEKLVVNFRANTLEDMVTPARDGVWCSVWRLQQVFWPADSRSRRLGLLRVPITFGIAAGLLTAGLVIDLLRGR